jgi:hypothetical protein
MAALAETLSRISTAAYQAAGPTGADGTDGAGAEPSQDGETSGEAAAEEEAVEGEYKEV